MNLEDVENFRKSLKTCPDCGSEEGFWFVAKHDKTCFQCKHCAATLEICEVAPGSKVEKDSKKLLARLRS